jgi:hypothetical protein
VILCRIMHYTNTNKPCYLYAALYCNTAGFVLTPGWLLVTPAAKRANRAQKAKQGGTPGCVRTHMFLSGSVLSCELRVLVAPAMGTLGAKSACCIFSAPQGRPALPVAPCEQNATYCERCGSQGSRRGGCKNARLKVGYLKIYGFLHIRGFLPVLQEKQPFLIKSDAQFCGGGS